MVARAGLVLMALIYIAGAVVVVRLGTIDTTSSAIPHRPDIGSQVQDLATGGYGRLPAPAMISSSSARTEASPNMDTAASRVARY